MSAFDDDHPFIKQVKDHSAGGEVSLDDIAVSFAACPDGQRTELLQKMETWFDQPASSRKTAQLFELNKKMKQMHRKLRVLGR
jgi:hypothetical protein